MNIINNAYAQSAGPADGGMSMLIMVVLFFIIMYFMKKSVSGTYSALIFSC